MTTREFYENHLKPTMEKRHYHGLTMDTVKITLRRSPEKWQEIKKIVEEAETEKEAIKRLQPIIREEMAKKAAE